MNDNPLRVFALSKPINDVPSPLVRGVMID